MTTNYTSARSKIKGIIEGTTPERLELGLGPSFQYLHDVSPERLVNSRQFCLRAQSGLIAGPLTKNTRQRDATVQLFIRYLNASDAALLDEIIHSDVELISERLIDPSLYDQSTTGLVTVGNGLELLSFSVDFDDEGSALVTLQIDMRYRLSS